jgi:hypothetical protein
MNTEKKYTIHGAQREKYPLYAAEGVQITPNMLGRKVEFKSYENGRPVQGIGTFAGIDFNYHTIFVQMEKPIIISSKFGSYKTDTIQMSSSYQFEEPSGCHVHREATSWQHDYPQDASIVLRFI